jgi:hypothetical protein
MQDLRVVFTRRYAPMSLFGGVCPPESEVARFEFLIGKIIDERMEATIGSL